MKTKKLRWQVKIQPPPNFQSPSRIPIKTQIIDRESETPVRDPDSKHIKKSLRGIIFLVIWGKICVCVCFTPGNVENIAGNSWRKRVLQKEIKLRGTFLWCHIHYTDLENTSKRIRKSILIDQIQFVQKKKGEHKDESYEKSRNMTQCCFTITPKL